MHPVLFKIGNITLYTYGLFVGLGFMAALWAANKRAEKSGINTELVSDLFFCILLSSLVGARLFYVILNFSEFAASPMEVLKIWNGGLVFYGGFVVAMVSAMVFVKKKGLLLWSIADLLAPPIALGHAVGRIGCFFAGCCHGKECNLPWAVEFHNPDALAPLGVLLHPTQLYSVISNFSIFLVLLWMDRRKRFNGQIFWAYIFLYGLMRSLIEVYRGDFRGNFFMETLSVSQTMGITMSCFAAIMLFWLSRKEKNARD